MSEPRFIRIGQLASTPQRSGRLPFSPNSIWRLSRLGRFPKPIKLSEAVTAWRLEEVESWEAARVAGASDEQLRELVAKLHAKREGLLAEVLR